MLGAFLDASFKNQNSPMKKELFLFYTEKTDLGRFLTSSKVRMY